jgi:hypothetical protein
MCVVLSKQLVFFVVQQNVRMRQISKYASTKVPEMMTDTFKDWFLNRFMNYRHLEAGNTIIIEIEAIIW